MFIRNVKKSGLIFISFLMLVSYCVPFIGSAESEATLMSEQTLISTPEQLVAFANSVNSGSFMLNAKLSNDIDMSQLTGDGSLYSFTPIGKSDSSVYDGVFDGAGYTVKNFKITATDNKYSGFFGYVFTNAEIKNLIIEGEVNAAYAAGVAGVNYGNIHDCTSRARVSGGVAGGGITAYNYGKITNCSNYVKLSTEFFRAGGICVFNQGNGIIDGCVNYAEVSGDTYGKNDTYSIATAGICTLNYAKVKNCINNGRISGGDKVGGIVGENGGDITDCKNFGEIYCSIQYAGGICGNYSYGTVKSCTNYANITALISTAGGIIGNAGDMYTTYIFENCVNFGDVTTVRYGGGIVGYSMIHINSCTNYGNVNCLTPYNANDGKSFGGICGYSYCNIKNCLNEGKISGTTLAGGIVGKAVGGRTIQNCLNKGDVTSSRERSGGIVGEIGSSSTKLIQCGNMGAVESGTSGIGNFVGGLSAVSYGTATDCYNTGKISGISSIAGFIGYNTNTVKYGYNTGTPTVLFPSGTVKTAPYVYSTSAHSQVIQKTENEFSDTTVVNLLNTLDGTVENRGIWRLENGIPVSTDSTLFTVLCKETPDEFTIPERVCSKAENIIIPAAENEGISYDIYPVLKSPYAYFMMPTRAESSNVVYYTTDKDGNKLERFTTDLTGASSEKVKILDSEYIIKAYQSDISTFYIQIDESAESIRNLNTSFLHDVTAYGDIRVDVSDKVAEKRGCENSYTSVENDETSVGSMEIRGRGNSSWSVDASRKKSYQFKTEKKIDLFGMGAAKKWVLVANDKELFKNKLGLDLGQEMDIPYCSDSEFCEVFLNGVFLGTYMMSEKVEVNPERINISDLDKEKEEKGITEATDLTGGYLIEVDNTAEALTITTNGVNFTVKNPEELDTKVSETNNYSYITKLTKDLFNTIYTKPDGLMSNGKSYLDKIDIDSFVRYYWNQEFLGNLDCGKGSTFFFKDKDSIDDKIYAGPIWDNDGIYIVWQTTGWLLNKNMNSSGVPIVYNALLQRKDFASYAVWYYENCPDIKNSFTKAYDMFNEYVDELSVSGVMNSLRWSNGSFNISDYKGNFKARAKWIDENYKSLLTLATLGDYVNIAAPAPSETPAPSQAPQGSAEPESICEFSFTGGIAEANVDGDKTEGYAAVSGKNSLSSRLFGSVNGSDLRKLEWSKDSYTDGENEGLVPLITAGNSNNWGDMAYFKVKTSTKGYENVTFSAKLGGSKKGAKNFKLRYSTDDVNYTDVPGAVYSIASNKTMFPAFEKVSLPSAAADKESLYIQIVTSDTETIDGALLSANPASGENAINSIAVTATAKTGAQQNLSVPISRTSSGASLYKDDSIELICNDSTLNIMYTISNGTDTTQPMTYAQPIRPFELLSGDSLTITAWSADGENESDRTQYHYSLCGEVLSGYSYSGYTETFEGKANAVRGMYKNSTVSCSADGKDVYVPMFDENGLVIAPDDGIKWGQNGYWMFETSTAGYKNIKFSADAASSSKGPKSFTLQYSSDGINFTDLEVNKAVPVSDMGSYYTLYELPEELNNQPRVFIRLLMQENKRASLTDSSALFNNEAKGNTYINNVIISGNPLENSLVIPVLQNKTHAFNSEQKIYYSVPDGAAAKYTVYSADGVEIEKNLTYSDGIDLSKYDIDELKISIWNEKDESVSAVITDSFFFAGTSIAVSSSDNPNSNIEISMLPDGVNAAQVKNDDKYGFKVSATDTAAWSSSVHQTNDGYWLLKLSSKGYKNLSFNAQMMSSAKGPRDFSMQASTDGINYFDVSNSKVKLIPSMIDAYKSFRLPSVLDNCDTVYLKIKINGGENVDKYELNDAENSLGKGNTGIQNISLCGEAYKNELYMENVVVDTQNDSISVQFTNGTDADKKFTAAACVYRNGKMVDTALKQLDDVQSMSTTEAQVFELPKKAAGTIKIIIVDSMDTMKPVGKEYIIQK